MGVFDWMSGGGQAGGGGGYMDQMVNYGMQFGGPQFGISPDQRANYFKQQELAQNLKFINENQIPGQGAYGPEPDGAISANQFNPAKNMELAMRTGQMGQYIAGQQALERQRDGQQWSQNNMPLADKTRLDILQTQQKWENERRQFEWNTPSAVQNAQIQNARGHLGVSQGNQRLQQQEFNARYLPDPQRPGSFMPRPVMPQAPVGYQWNPQVPGALQAIPGTKPYIEQREGQDKLASGVNGIDQLIEFTKKYGAGETGAEAGRMSAGPRQQVIAALAAANNMGVLQSGELDQLLEQVNDPNAWGSILNPFKSGDTVIGKMTGVRDRLIQASKDAASRAGGASSIPAPPPGFRKVQ